MGVPRQEPGLSSEIERSQQPKRIAELLGNIVVPMTIIKTGYESFTASVACFFQEPSRDAKLFPWLDDANQRTLEVSRKRPFCRVRT